MADDKKKQEQTVQTAQTVQHITPQGYTSPYQDKIDKILDQYQNREPFQFNVNEDALYNQYKDQYIKHGNLAMKDTMGQAAALTGGYGNSYAQTAGQQVFQGYMQDLNDVIPDLWQQALERYQKEGSDMLSEYGLLSDLESQEYSRYQDAASLARSQVDNMIAMGIMPDADLIQQAGYSQSYAQQMVAKTRAQMSSGGGGGRGGGGGGQSNYKKAEDMLANGGYNSAQMLQIIRTSPLSKKQQSSLITKYQKPKQTKEVRSKNAKKDNSAWYNR